jgi:hypothetical protein
MWQKEPQHVVKRKWSIASVGYKPWRNMGVGFRLQRMNFIAEMHRWPLAEQLNEEY